eukprot:scaffold16090_cov99-Isochrysis_galbana.AAC.2
MRDGTAQDRGHPLPPQLTSAAKRALSAARRKAMADSLLLTGAEQPVSPDVAEHPDFPKECGAEDSGGAACTGWAATGECEKNAGWMHKGCVHACGLCGGAPAPQAAALPVQVESDCADQSSFCGQWAAVGECDSNPGYMRTNCKVCFGAALLASPSPATHSPPNPVDCASLSQPPLPYNFLCPPDRCNTYPRRRTASPHPHPRSPATCASRGAATTSTQPDAKLTRRRAAARPSRTSCSTSAGGRADGARGAESHGEPKRNAWGGVTLFSQKGKFGHMA